MPKYIISSILLLILHGLTIIGGTWAKVPSFEKPTLYNSVIVQFILNIALIFYILFSVYFLIFINWKLYILLFIIGSLIGKPILYPISEFIVIFPIYKVLEHMSNKNSQL